jgi:hypothetical protein
VGSVSARIAWSTGCITGAKRAWGSVTIHVQRSVGPSFAYRAARASATGFMASSFAGAAGWAGAAGSPGSAGAGSATLGMSRG